MLDVEQKPEHTIMPADDDDENVFHAEVNRIPPELKQLSGPVAMSMVLEAAGEAPPQEMAKKVAAAKQRYLEIMADPEDVPIADWHEDIAHKIRLSLGVRQYQDKPLTDPTRLSAMIRSDDYLEKLAAQMVCDAIVEESEKGAAGHDYRTLMKSKKWQDAVAAAHEPFYVQAREKEKTQIAKEYETLRRELPLVTAQIDKDKISETTLTFLEYCQKVLAAVKYHALGETEPYAQGVKEALAKIDAAVQAEGDREASRFSRTMKLQTRRLLRQGEADAEISYRHRAGEVLSNPYRLQTGPIQR